MEIQPTGGVMQRTLLIKLVIIGVVSLLLLIPLGLIEGVVSERSHYRYEVTQDIAQSWTAQQDVIGPILTVPYKKKIRYKTWDVETQKSIPQVRFEKDHFYYLPDNLEINGDSTIQERYRGIYKVPVYTSKLDIKGHFDMSNGLAEQLGDAVIQWEDAFVSIEIGDIRGIKTGLKLVWNGDEKEFMPGTNLDFMSQGINAQVGKPNLTNDKKNSFSFSLELNGIEYLRFSPIGETTSVNISSSWPHPKFIGRYLPQQREVSDSGFTANWATSHFSTNMSELLRVCNEHKCNGFSQDLFGVSFVQPVDIYHQAERSIKYAILFILLTFVIFFTFEMLKGLLIHPIQYGLVGLGLAIFYLLLVSLSEHMAFGLAYFISSLACISLLGFYVSFVMKSVRRGVAFGSLLTFLYGILYMLIRSEDYALLMGALLVFVTLASTMYFTRRIDWYQTVDGMSQRKEAKDEA